MNNIRSTPTNKEDASYMFGFVSGFLHARQNHSVVHFFPLDSYSKGHDAGWEFALDQIKETE